MPKTTSIDWLKKLVENQKQFQKAQKELEEELSELGKDKTPGTVIFCDLKGSTGYRRRYGAEAGLMKAFLHNRTVSEAIAGAGGRVVKWMGDGVLGLFAQDECGDEHPFKALIAALVALNEIKALNSKEPLRRLVSAANPGEYVEHDHEVHTKVAICSGALHFFDFAPAKGSTSEAPPAAPPGGARDPMGSCVDLAARLSHLAEADVVLINEDTFWGHTPKDEKGNPLLSNPIAGVCQLPRDEISWRRFIFPWVRETVYVPHVTAFLVGPEKMHACRLVQAGDAPILKQKCVELANRDRLQNGHSDASIVYALGAVPCNVAGFEKPVNALALTLEPQERPIKHAVHEWDDPKLQHLLHVAELCYRRGGDPEQAALKYEEVRAKDPRNFPANVRLAMIARSKGNNVLAMERLMAAKESDPECPLAWAVAGMTHLDDLLHNMSDRTEGLVRAITGFSRAKYLAAQKFYGLLEQYCTAMLAISHFLRRDPEGDDMVKGKTLVDELRNWPPKNTITRYATTLAGVYLKIAQDDKQGALAEVNTLLEEIKKNAPVREKAVDDVPYDHVIQLKDIKNLLRHAECIAQIE
ncbi:MAG TPA: tetratricopeptide repeat protein [Gemmataceae bacterium]|nr:tetratricopeptide repeat protein [Gemmataceae bacterium]